ncbi:hypothetical protein JaAD80_07085 [Janthinobacterium sp. AD80]|nr:hypothetical protein JaAD80_07085 [Janthinobacterium sp. AD80]
MSIATQLRFVEQSHHGILAKNAGHDGNPEVQFARTQLDAEATILRHATLGDIELR